MLQWRKDRPAHPLMRVVPLGAALARLSSLADFGTAGYTPDVKRRLKTLNVMAYLIAFFTLLYTLQHIVGDYRTFAPVVWINLALVAAALLVPFMHRLSDIAGGLLIAGAEFAGIFALASYLGSPAGLHIQYIVGAAAPFFVFGLTRLRLVLLVVAVSFALHVAVWALFPAPDPAFVRDPLFIPSLYLSAAVTTFAMIGAIVYYAFRLAERARAETDALLRNVLPEPIVERLKAEPGVTIADSFAEASVLFADIQGFVPLSIALGPARTVEFLNWLSQEFDHLAALHGAEKIKTIGDAYMAAAGIPEPVGDPAHRLTRLGLAMVAAVDRLDSDLGRGIAMRVGIATGPVLAGVIGAKRITYDVWGDTVNLAARLESTGVTGRVQVCATTRARLDETFVLEPRGTIDIKGFGHRETWLVVGARAEALPNAGSRYA